MREDGRVTIEPLRAAADLFVLPYVHEPAHRPFLSELLRHQREASGEQI
jgi:hypothetical protein